VPIAILKPPPQGIAGARPPSGRHPWNRFVRVVGLLALPTPLLLIAAEPAAACERWRCPEDGFEGGGYAYRAAPRTDGAARSYRYGRRSVRPSWVYGYTSPARARGYAYAPWSSTAIPPRPWYGRTALQVPNANAVGLTAPYATFQGLLESSLPPSGPSLFGPDPPPAWGYYGAPAYGYYGYSAAPTYRTPPSDSPSWWAEPRRRR
jgi:hypothetical protein